MRKLLLSLGLVLLFSVEISASNGIEIKGIQYGRAGCPKGSVKAELSESNNFLHVHFDKFEAVANKDSDEKPWGESECILYIHLDAPPELTARIRMAKVSMSRESTPSYEMFHYRDRFGGIFRKIYHEPLHLSGRGKEVELDIWDGNHRYPRPGVALELDANIHLRLRSQDKDRSKINKISYFLDWQRHDEINDDEYASGYDFNTFLMYPFNPIFHSPWFGVQVAVGLASVISVGTIGLLHWRKFHVS